MFDVNNAVDVAILGVALAFLFYGVDKILDTISKTLENTWLKGLVPFLKFILGLAYIIFALVLLHLIGIIYPV